MKHFTLRDAPRFRGGVGPAALLLTACLLCPLQTALAQDQIEVSAQCEEAEDVSEFGLILPEDGRYAVCELSPDVGVTVLVNFEEGGTAADFSVQGFVPEQKLSANPRTEGLKILGNDAQEPDLEIPGRPILAFNLFRVEVKICDPADEAIRVFVVTEFNNSDFVRDVSPEVWISFDGGNLFYLPDDDAGFTIPVRERDDIPTLRAVEFLVLCSVEAEDDPETEEEEEEGPVHETGN